MKLSPRSQDAEIPTTSMADIAFLLMIFFMITAVFSATKGLELRLPEEEHGQPVEPQEATFIKVEGDSSITVDCAPMALSDLLDYLAPRHAHDPERPVILYTDAYAPYQAMISVYDVLGSAERERGFKIRNVSVPTQSDVQEYIELFGFNPFESQCGG